MGGDIGEEDRERCYVADEGVGVPSQDVVGRLVSIRFHERGDDTEVAEQVEIIGEPVQVES